MDNSEVRERFDKEGLITIDDHNHYHIQVGDEKIGNDKALEFLKSCIPLLTTTERRTQVARCFKFKEVRKQKLKPGEYRWLKKLELMRKIEDANPSTVTTNTNNLRLVSPVEDIV